MFGFGLGEFLLVLVVGIVVVGPRNLPTLMRTAGKWVAKLRRLSTDLRAQSGIDDLIREEGLEREIQELRALSRVNVLESLVAPGLAAATAPRPRPALQPVTPALPADNGDEPLREREYPDVGCDAYDCLPDDVVPYPEPAVPAEPKPEPGPEAVAAPADAEAKA